MGARADLSSAQAGVSRSNALISQAKAQIASAKARGRSTSSGERLLAAAKQNLSVFQGRANTAFRQVAQEAAARAVAQAKARAAAARKAAIAAAARQKAQQQAAIKSAQIAAAKRTAQEKQRQAELVRKKKADESAAKALQIQQALAASKESDRLAKQQRDQAAQQALLIPEVQAEVPELTLEQKIGELKEAKAEQFEATKDQTPQAFTREGVPVEPGSLEGRFIDIQKESQDVNIAGAVANVDRFGSITLAGSGVEALRIAKETPVAEPILPTGSSQLVDVTGTIDPFSGKVQKGTGFGDIGRFEEIGGFDAPGLEETIVGFEQTPPSLQESLGFGAKTPKTPKKITAAKSSDPLSVLISAGLTPTTQKIQSGFIPTSKAPTPFSGSLESLFGQAPKQKPPKRGIAPGAAAFIAAPKVAKTTVQGFESFLGDLRSEFGISSATFAGAGLSFESLFGGLVPGVSKPKKVKKVVKKTGLSAAQKAAKAQGFSLSSSGKAFKFKTVGGRKVIVAEGKSVAGLKTKIAVQKRVAAAKAAAKRAKAVAAAKAKVDRSRRKRARQKKGKTGARAPSAQKKTTKRKVVKVSSPSAGKRSSQKSKDFISSGGRIGRSPRSEAIKKGPSGTTKKKKPPVVKIKKKPPKRKPKRGSVFG